MMAPTLLQKILGGVVGPSGEKVMFTFYWVNSMITYATYYLMIVPVVSSAQSLAFAISSVMMIIYFLRAHTTCPGLVPTTGRSHEMYLTALELAAEGQVEQASEIGNLCHTCRIARPLRSKHCVMLKRCVSVFDHHCPYVSNTLGAANYFYFIIFMFYGLVAISLALAGCVQYLYTLGMDKWIIFQLCDHALFDTFAVVMNGYHSMMIMKNLTTNEQMNYQRYPYLRDEMGRYRNAFDDGPIGNIVDLWRRRDAVAASPYLYTDRYTKRQVTEMLEMKKGDGEKHSLLNAIEEGTAEEA